MNTLIKDILGTVAREVTGALVQNPKVPVENYDRPVVEPVVERELQEKVAPVIEHLTNNEPWYRSRVTLGALAVIASSLFGVFQEWAYNDLDFSDIQVHGVAIFGAATTLWGRWAAKKPIGA